MLDELELAKLVRSASRQLARVERQLATCKEIRDEHQRQIDQLVTQRAELWKQQWMLRRSPQEKGARRCHSTINPNHPN